MTPPRDKIIFVRDQLTRTIRETHEHESLAFIRQLLIAIRDECDDMLAREPRHES